MILESVAHFSIATPSHDKSWFASTQSINHTQIIITPCRNVKNVNFIVTNTSAELEYGRSGVTESYKVPLSKEMLHRVLSWALKGVAARNLNEVMKIFWAAPNLEKIGHVKCVNDDRVKLVASMTLENNANPYLRHKLAANPQALTNFSANGINHSTVAHTVGKKSI